MILLDTDILTHLFQGHQKLKARFESASDERIATTIVTRIEILRGRFESVVKAANENELLTAIQRLELSERNLNQLDIISVDANTATIFYTLSRDKKAKKIARNDLLIASICLSHQATLVTRNIRHFQPIKELIVENWME